jgi:hypothetical protein
MARGDHPAYLDFPCPLGTFMVLDGGSHGERGSSRVPRLSKSTGDFHGARWMLPWREGNVPRTSTFTVRWGLSWRSIEACDRTGGFDKVWPLAPCSWM